MTAAELAGLDEAAFVAAFGGVYERSPWIARRAFARAPFASFAALETAMAAALDAAGPEAAITLVRAHPDLAGKASLAGMLTDNSRAEQRASGLSDLAVEELARFTRLNEAYRAKFGFPFVMAVRRSDKHAILAAFAERLDDDASAELARAVAEIKIIARLRLEAIAAG